MGWARANLVYEKLDHPPAPGTPLESLILLVWRMRQDIKLAETRAIVQAVASAASGSSEGDKALQEAWKGYVGELFPFHKRSIQNQDLAAIDYLRREVSKGPLSVVPLQPVGKSASRMRRRTVENEEAQKLRREQQGRTRQRRIT